MSEDMVNHPNHYTRHPSKVECICITRHHNFNIGNAIKYLWRCGIKKGHSELEDLRKAKWYIDDELCRMQGIERDTSKMEGFIENG